MKKLFIKNSFNSLIVKYLVSFFVYLVLYFTLPVPTPFLISAYPSFAIYGLNPIILTLQVLLVLLINKAYFLILPSLISLVILSVVFLIYKRRNTKPSYELTLYILLSLTYYFVTEGNFYYAFLISIATTVVSFIFISTLNFIVVKGLKFYPTPQEIILLTLAVIMVHLGLINLITPFYTKLITVFLILFISKTTVDGVGIYASIVLSIPFIIFYKDPTISVYFVFIAFLTGILNNVSHYISGISILITDYLFNYIFNFNPNYGVYEFCLLTLVVIIYFLIPKKAFIYTKSHLTGYKNKYLIKQTINNNRLIIADKLYDLSHVFNDISNCFEEFKKCELDDNVIKKSIVDKVYTEVCKCCNFSNTCPLFLNKNQNNVKIYLEKVVEIGLAKNKITFMDTPKELSDNCGEINPILYAVNKELNDYKALSNERESLSTSKELIAKQADGIAKMLYSLAFTTSATLKFNYEIENEITKALLKKGLNPLEVLIFTNNNQITISLLFNNDKINVNLLEKTVSYVTQKPLKVLNAINLNNNYYVTLSIPKKYKTIFGVATATKTLSDFSGDTHTEVLIPNSKVLYAISDGMGSGKTAKKISTTTLTLIESFYKAGLPSETVLPLVNKILTLNTDENFSALDIAVLDLDSLSVDFIKFGAPRGYVITERGIKIVEGNTLPIGILKEVQPVVANTTLKPNDVLILISDGIHDAFNSSSDLIDYLKELTPLNPQSIADNVLNKARQLNDNVNLDDMTVLCVRVYSV